MTNSDDGDIERPCVKCGVVDSTSNMLLLTAPNPDGLDDYRAWVHEHPCYTSYAGIVMELQTFELGDFLDGPGTQALLRERGK
jgi:hypothetical protein